MANLTIPFLVITLSLASYCALAENVELKVQAVTSISSTDDTFICATLDWWPETKCDYGQCPWGKASLLNLDLSNPIVINAVKEFGSLRLRLGGSLQDQVVYKVGNAVKDFPTFKRHDGDGYLFGFTRGTLDMQRWDKLNEFFRMTNAKITFGLNDLLGKNKSNGSTLWTGEWYSQNARDFMAYTASKGYKIDSYELGNELCGSGVSARVEAEQYAKDTIALKNLVAEIYPDPASRPKVLGPAGFYDQQWFNTYLAATGHNVLDGVTHHIYNLGAGVDKDLINKIQDPRFLSQIAQTFKDVAESVGKFAPWSHAWVGESGGAYNSGGKDVSHTFVDGFWYLDQLGMTSTFNHKVYCRQTLIGGNYGLLNTTTFIPNPDYYSALLWHRLMGNNVLATNHMGSPFLRAYAHCSKTKPGITILFINMSNSTSFDVKVLNDANLYEQWDGQDTEYSQQREEYHLTPQDGNIQSDVVLLNGTPLKVSRESTIPEMKPVFANSTYPITIASDSIVFVTIRDFNAPACA